ncbi:DUF6719 family protein [Rhizobium sp. BK650]|uniref:DUF6719 family protein n=1 Tax=Rhizobium sp. BK650 TaxID=2586990 RepID=UPI003917C4F7
MTRGAPFILCLSALASCSPPVVDKVPDKGALRQGQQVIVTDDSCPPSEMKLVTGGHVGQPNEVECVPKFR